MDRSSPSERIHVWIRFLHWRKRRRTNRWKPQSTSNKGPDELRKEQTSHQRVVHFWIRSALSTLFYVWRHSDNEVLTTVVGGTPSRTVNEVSFKTNPSLRLRLHANLHVHTSPWPDYRPPTSGRNRCLLSFVSCHYCTESEDTRRWTGVSTQITLSSRPNPGDSERTTSLIPSLVTGRQVTWDHVKIVSLGFGYGKHTKKEKIHC